MAGFPNLHTQCWSFLVGKPQWKLLGKPTILGVHPHINPLGLMGFVEFLPHQKKFRSTFSSWWLVEPTTQPIWKRCAGSQNGSFRSLPQGLGWKFQKSLSCHHLVIMDRYSPMELGWWSLSPYYMKIMGVDRPNRTYGHKYTWYMMIHEICWNDGVIL